MRLHFRSGRIVFVLAVTSILAACSPKIYVIDRQTVLEQEASGEWPEFDKALLEKSKAPTPTPFSSVPFNERRQRVYRVLHGDMSHQAAGPTHPTGEGR